MVTTDGAGVSIVPVTSEHCMMYRHDRLQVRSVCEPTNKGQINPIGSLPLAKVGRFVVKATLCRRRRWWKTTNKETEARIPAKFTDCYCNGISDTKGFLSGNNPAIFRQVCQRADDIFAARGASRGMALMCVEVKASAFTASLHNTPVSHPFTHTYNR